MKLLLLQKTVSTVQYVREVNETLHIVQAGLQHAIKL